jgi:hypothetical protein
VVEAYNAKPLTEQFPARGSDMTEYGLSVVLVGRQRQPASQQRIEVFVSHCQTAASVPVRSYDPRQPYGSCRPILSSRAIPMLNCRICGWVILRER